MNLSYFLARRITREQKNGFASTIHKIAIVTMAVGLAASIVSFLIMEGFRSNVTNRVYSFSAHILVNRLTLSNSTEEQPFGYHIALFDRPQEFENVRHVQEFVHKPGLIKADEEVLGVVFKGVGRSFDTNSFRQNMLDGRFLNFPDSGYASEVVLSKVIARKIKANTGDDIIIHFFQNPPRFRRLKVAGIYETNLSDYFDSKVIIGDIRLIQRLNDWPDSVAGGLEVFVKDTRRIDATTELIGERMDFDLFVEKVSDRYVQVFEWLGLVTRQVNILLGIIVIIVCVNMISVVLILVMERTQMIGMLKALGARDRVVRSVFVYQGIQLIAWGMLFGNLIGLGICWLQHTFRIIPLNPHDYYIDYVPIGWDWTAVGMINLLIFTVVSLVLLFPSAVVARISPIRAIRFD